MSTKPSLLQRGVSLVELIMFIVIVSTALAGILLVMDKVSGHSSDPLVRKQALAIAESMLEEVQLQSLDPASCTAALGADADRTGNHCVNDYNGYHTTNGIRDFSTNAPIQGLGGYNITNVAVAQVNALGGMAIQAGSAVEITVTVTDTAGDPPMTAIGYRAGN